MNAKVLGRYKIAVEVIMVMVSFFVIMVPLLIMIFGSFKNPLEVTAFNLALPERWLWQNFVEVIQRGNLARAFFNGMFIAVTSTALTIGLGSMATYVIARRGTRFTTFLFYFFFAGTFIPMQFIPTIRIFVLLGIYGGYLNAILIYCALNISFACFLFTGFIKGIPRALDEAAFIEGASIIKTYFLVIFPLLKPVSMTVLVLVFMNIWNDINIPLYFLTNPARWTMPLAVYQFFGMFSASHWNLVFANLTLTALPVVLLFLCAQNFIITGLTEGSIKG